MKLIPEFLAGIDYLVKRAEQLKIRDKLVIVVQSELDARRITTRTKAKTTGRSAR
jgi:hypothetical protein